MMPLDVISHENQLQHLSEPSIFMLDVFRTADHAGQIFIPHRRTKAIDRLFLAIVLTCVLLVGYYKATERAAFVRFFSMRKNTSNRFNQLLNKHAEEIANLSSVEQQKRAAELFSSAFCCHT